MNTILTNQLKDTDTVLQIKQDTTNILNELKNDKIAKRYGYRIKKSESDPSARVEYLYDAIGMTPAHMNFTTDTFDYGSWGNIWFIKNNYPVMLKYDGTEDYRLNPNDYSIMINIDGASKYNDTTYEGNAMSAIPLVWVKRYQEEDYEYVIFCEQKYDDSYKAYAHTDANGNIKPYVYHSMFKGGMVNEQIRSIAGLYPQNFTNAHQELTAIKKNGNNWYMRTWSMQQLIADLLTLISKTENSQEAFGTGRHSGYVDNAEQHYGIASTGNLYNKGQFYGKNDGTTQVKVFHIEDFWANRWDRIQGLVQRNGSIMAKMTPEGDGYNFTGVGYSAIGAPSLVKQTHGWQKDTFQSEYGRIPVYPHSGSDSTYVCDFFWLNAEYNEPLVALCGGYCADGSWCGSRYLSLNASPAGSDWHLGASPTYI